MTIITADRERIIIRNSEGFVMRFRKHRCNDCLLLKCFVKGGEKLVLSSEHFSNLPASQKEEAFNSVHKFIINMLLTENVSEINIRAIIEDYK